MLQGQPKLSWLGDGLHTCNHTYWLLGPLFGHDNGWDLDCFDEGPGTIPLNGTPLLEGPSKDSCLAMGFSLNLVDAMPGP